MGYIKRYFYVNEVWKSVITVWIVAFKLNYSIIKGIDQGMKTDPKKIFIRDFDYPLTHDRIAEFPVEKRDQSRLLVYREGTCIDDHFYNIHQHLPENATLVVNNTRVIEARVLFQKQTGGVIEIFCLEPHGQHMEKSLASPSPVQWQCMIGGASKWKPGQVLEKKIRIAGEEATVMARFIAREPDHFLIEFSWEPFHFSFSEILHASGAIPLPPYIKRQATSYDAERYQTIFGKNEGSVAAPTSALHFTPEVFTKLDQKGIEVENITLHVGAGTFKPVKTETVADHVMHGEPFSIQLESLKKIAASRYIIAVGTTTLRTLESLYWIGVKFIHTKKEDYQLKQWEVYELEEKYPSIAAQEVFDFLIRWMERNQVNEMHCNTSLIIMPGYRFNIPHALITNFHQPQSTLLLLVSAFIGKEWKRVYQHALENNYRFLSYGDSSLLWKKD